MSASNEKRTFQDLASFGQADPKTAQEAQQRKAEKRSNLLYGTIAVVFVLVAVVSLIWNSNILARTLPAVTIGDETYTAAEVDFYYHNVYQSFLSNYSYYTSYLGLNTSESLRSQTIDETAAAMLDGAEAGSTWHDYFLNQAIQQMTTIQAVLEDAEAQGFVYPEGVEAQYQDSVASLEQAATASALSPTEYLRSSLGSSVMTEEIYNAQVLRMLQYTAYVNNYTDNLTYTDEALEAAYAEDSKLYDLVSYECVTVSGTAESTTDEEGNTVSPTEEESAAAKEAAESTANELLAAYRAGGDLETLAEGHDKATYSSGTNGTYLDDEVTNWLFDEARVSGDSAVINNGASNYYVLVFRDRYREEYNTIDVRHILIPLGESTLSSTDEGYEDEQAQLKADAKAQAEELLEQWKAGEATEESFAALAMEHSSDSSKYTGGLYTEVYHDQMVTTFNDWCFDPARQSGDTGVVESDYGAHVMYFVGEDLPRWASQVAYDLKTEDFNAWISDLSASYGAVSHNFAMKFVG